MDGGQGECSVPSGMTQGQKALKESTRDAALTRRAQNVVLWDDN